MSNFEGDSILASFGEVQNFNPGSMFGLPLTPFPPGMRWNTRRDMLHEVMTDLHRGWVQNYLTCQNASDDARVLSSPAQLSKSLSVTFTGSMDIAKKQSIVFPDMLCTILLVPAFKTDDISAGLSVEHYFGAGAPPEIMSERDRFVRYVRNDRTGAICTVRMEEEGDIVDVCYYTMQTSSNSVHLALKFRTEDFKTAFVAGSVDFRLLERSMLSLIVGCSSLGPTPCTCQNTTCSECFTAPAPFMLSPACDLSFVDYIQFGDFYSKSVVSEYNGGMLITAKPIFAFTSRKYGAPGSAIDMMINWGMADRLGRLKPVASAGMQVSLESVDAADQVGTGFDFSVEISATDVDEVLFGDSPDVVVEPSSLMVTPIASLETEPGRIGDASLNRFEALDSGSEHILSIAKPFIQAPHVHVPAVCNNSTKSAVRIAPAPSGVGRLSGNIDESASLLKVMENKRLAKLEQRKIRKREAAFRSNVKRSEHRRVARLAREREREACLSTT